MSTGDLTGGGSVDGLRPLDKETMSLEVGFLVESAGTLFKRAVASGAVPAEDAIAQTTPGSACWSAIESIQSAVQTGKEDEYRAGMKAFFAAAGKIVDKAKIDDDHDGPIVKGALFHYRRLASMYSL
jgi:hypothetical protein